MMIRLAKLAMVNMGMMMLMMMMAMMVVMMVMEMVTMMGRCRKPPTLESQTEEESLLPTTEDFWSLGMVRTMITPHPTNNNFDEHQLGLCIVALWCGSASVGMTPNPPQPTQLTHLWNLNIPKYPTFFHPFRLPRPPVNLFKWWWQLKWDDENADS